jgi:hypothetical protein
VVGCLRAANEPGVAEQVQAMALQCCEAAVGACGAPSSRRASTAGGGALSGPLPPFPPSALPAALLQQLAQLQRRGAAGPRAGGATLLATLLRKVGPGALDGRRAQLVVEGALAALQRPDAVPQDYAGAAAALGSCVATKRPQAALDAARVCVGLGRSGLAVAAAVGGCSGCGGGSSRACAELLLANSVLQALAQQLGAQQLLERRLPLPAEVPGLQLVGPAALQATAQQLGSLEQEALASPLLEQAHGGAQGANAQAWAEQLAACLAGLPAFEGAYSRDDFLAPAFAPASALASPSPPAASAGPRAASPGPRPHHLQASPKAQQARRDLRKDVLRVVDLLGDSDAGSPGSSAAGLEAAAAAAGAAAGGPGLAAGDGLLQLGDLLQLADQALLAGQ